MHGEITTTILSGAGKDKDFYGSLLGSIDVNAKNRAGETVIDIAKANSQNGMTYTLNKFSKPEFGNNAAEYKVKQGNGLYNSEITLTSLSLSN